MIGFGVLSINGLLVRLAEADLFPYLCDTGIAALLLSILVVRVQKRFGSMAQGFFQELIVETNHIGIAVALADRAIGINAVD